MSFEPVDRIPLMEMGFWSETLERWHHEGLPKWVVHDRHLLYPPFEPRVLEETEEVQWVSKKVII